MQHFCVFIYKNPAFNLSPLAFNLSPLAFTPYTLHPIRYTETRNAYPRFCVVLCSSVFTNILFVKMSFRGINPNHGRARTGTETRYIYPRFCVVPCSSVVTNIPFVKMSFRGINPNHGRARTSRI